MNHSKLIINSGGEITDIFVIKPGIMITQKTTPTVDFEELSMCMNIDQSRPEYERHAEFNSRITYMSFKDENSSSEDYNKKMVEVHNHLSVYGDQYVSILMSGISIEASLEIISHNEASVSRLTSSKTIAQSNPLFVVNSAKQFEYIKKTIELRKDFLVNNLEEDNMLFPCNKATSIIATMSVKNWHKTLIGRLSSVGVEQEVQEIMKRVCVLLKENYPLVIKSVDEYYLMNNGEKYKS